MKTDYLWDKTGEDSEIEPLEATLSAFRYKPDDPPALPDAITESSRPRFWWLRFVLVPAAAACLVAAVVVGFWLRSPSNEYVEQVGGGEAQPKVELPPTDSKPGRRTGPESISITPPRPDTRAQGTDRIAITKVSHPVRASRKIQEPAVTREEKYAYDKLMLALSITGSKLRIVQDRVNGIELEKGGSKNDK